MIEVVLSSYLRLLVGGLGPDRAMSIWLSRPPAWSHRCLNVLMILQTFRVSSI